MVMGTVPIVHHLDNMRKGTYNTRAMIEYYPGKEPFSKPATKEDIRKQISKELDDYYSQADSFYTDEEGGIPELSQRYYEYQKDWKQGEPFSREFTPSLGEGSERVSDEMITSKIESFLQGGNLGKNELAGIAGALAGVDSQKAWEIRNRILDIEGMTIADIHASLVGLDSDLAWDMRDRLIKEGQSEDVLITLAGLTSARSWEWRKNLSPSSVSHALLASIVGIDEKEAWDMRYRFLAERRHDNQASDYMLGNISGIDSDRAWNFRESRENSRTRISPTSMIASLKGLDSERSRMLREEYYEKYKVSPLVTDSKDLFGLGMPAIMESLAGIDSEWAWEVRDEVIMKLTHAGKENLIQAIVGPSLVGLTSPRVEKIREAAQQSPYEYMKNLQGTGIQNMLIRMACEQKAVPHKLSSQDERVPKKIDLTKKFTEQEKEDSIQWKAQKYFKNGGYENIAEAEKRARQEMMPENEYQLFSRVAMALAEKYGVEINNQMLRFSTNRKGQYSWYFSIPPKDGKLFFMQQKEFNGPFFRGRVKIEIPTPRDTIRISDHIINQARRYGDDVVEDYIVYADTGTVGFINVKEARKANEDSPYDSNDPETYLRPDFVLSIDDLDQELKRNTEDKKS